MGIDYLNIPSSEEKPIQIMASEQTSWKMKEWLLLMSVILYASSLFLLFFQGIDGADGVIYADSAEAFRKNNGFVFVEKGTPIFSVRQGLLIPTAMALDYFGEAEWVLLIYPFIMAVGCAVLVFIIARLLFGSLAAMVAFFVYSSIPLVLRQGTVLGPEIPACFWATLGLYVTYVSVTSPKLKKTLITGGLAGLCFGASWLHKEGVSYLVPVVAVIVIWFGLRNTNAYWGGIAIATVATLFLGLEMAYYFEQTGDPLYHIHAVQKNFEVNGPYHYFVEGGLKGWKKGLYKEALVQRLFISGPLAVIRATFAIKLGFLAIFFAIFTRDRRFIFPSIWLCGLSGMFIFFTTDFQTYRPLVLEPRYLTPLFFPASVLTGGLISKVLFLSRNAKTNFQKLVIVSIPMILLGGLIYSSVSGVSYVFSHRPTYKKLRKTPDHIPSGATVFSDKKTLSGMRWLGFGENYQLRDYTELEPSNSHNGYLLLYWSRLNKNRDQYQMQLPSFVNNIPSDWSPVHQDGEVSIYLLTQEVK